MSFNTLITKFVRIFVPILVIVSLLYVGYLFITGQWSISYEEVKIKDFALCDEHGSLLNNPDEINRKRILFVCGDLISQNNLWMWIDLIKSDTNEYISSVPVAEQRFHPGSFIRYIEISKNLLPGDYEISVYLERKIVTSLSFSITDP